MSPKQVGLMAGTATLAAAVNIALVAKLTLATDTEKKNTKAEFPKNSERGDAEAADLVPRQLSYSAVEDHMSVLATLAPGQIQLKIMTFNLWYGGAQVNIHDTAAAIISSEADIVGIQEADANLFRLANLVGLPFVDERRSIISRFPIFDSGHGYQKDFEKNEYSTCGLDSDHGHAWVLVSPGKLVAFINTHMTSDPYGPDAVLAVIPNPICS